MTSLQIKGVSLNIGIPMYPGDTCKDFIPYKAST